MRLLIAADIFPPQSGGPATYSVAMANAFEKEGAPVKIVSLNKDSDTSLVQCPIFPVKYGNKILRYIHFAYLLIRHASDVDVIYAMGPVNAGFPGLFAAKLRGKKFTTKVVGDYAWEQGKQRFGVKEMIDEFQKRSDYSWKVKILKKIESFVVRNADKVIVPSKYLKGIVHGWGAEKQSIDVVYNAIKFKSVESAKKNHEEKWIVSVARLVPWKGMDTLIDVASKLSKTDPSIRLKIVGDGPEFNHLEKKVKDLGLEHMVELTGKLPREKTLSYIAGASVFVLNSGYEGLPHVVLEAMSYSVPVIASDAGGNSEIAQPYKTGLLFEYDNASDIEEKLKTVLYTDAVINPILHSAEKDEWLNNFTFETMFSRTKKVLEEL